jgi:peptidoglycan/xylan/chitin deacetylase (PgdA/CDA1 family)
MGPSVLGQLNDRWLLAIARALSHDWRRPHWRILCYHGVTAGDAESFRRQIAWFAEQFTFCTVTESAKLLSSGSVTKPVLSVTFDDGDRTVYDTALPILEFFGIHATLYITADYIERGQLYRDSSPGQAMSWEQIRDWASRGHEIGSHSLTHAPMPLCSPRRFEQEICISKAILEDKVSVPVVHFSYPWGQHSRHTAQRLKELGVYRTAATIDRGPMAAGLDLFRLMRDVVYPWMSVSQVETIMKLADRLYWLRHLKRRALGYWERHREIAWDDLSWPDAPESMKCPQSLP